MESTLPSLMGTGRHGFHATFSPLYEHTDLENTLCDRLDCPHPLRVQPVDEDLQLFLLVLVREAVRGVLVALALPAPRKQLRVPETKVNWSALAKEANY